VRLTTTGRRAKPALVGVLSEDAFEVQVMRLARLWGWCGFHIRYSVAATRGIHLLKRDGHMDGWGFPDWIFLKAGRPPKFRELKSDVGRMSIHQNFWQKLLAAAGADVGVWRPAMLQQIAEEFAA